MAADPAFASTPKQAIGQVTAANTNRDGTGTLVTLLTVGSTGAFLDKIRVHATVTTTAGMVRIFVSLDGGTTKRLVREIPILANTVSTTVTGFDAEVSINEQLPASAIVYASTHNAEAINVQAVYGEF